MNENVSRFGKNLERQCLSGRCLLTNATEATAILRIDWPQFDCASYKDHKNLLHLRALWC